MKKIFTIVLLFLFTISYSQLVITEIMYNTPGIDHTEFIEIHNAGDTGVNMGGYTMDGVDFTFPDMMVPAGSFVIITQNAAAFERAYGFEALPWDGGATSNGGEKIILYDSDGITVDSVKYDDGGDWSKIPDGYGSSLQICDVNADNSGADNWQASTNETTYMREGQRVYASPGFLGECIDKPIISVRYATGVYVEMVTDTIEVQFYMEDGENSSFNLNLGVNDEVTGNLANTEDHTGILGSYPFTNIDDGLYTIELPLLDDDLEENTEILALKITSNDDVVILNNTYRANIVDNEPSIIGNELVITGVADALTGTAGAQVIELTALEAIQDLSIYGLGVADDGEGSDGIEFILPAMAIGKCDRIYVVEDNGMTFDFFAFGSDIETSKLEFSGDDAIELFENGEVVDVFGDIETDGSGEPWDYKNGWAIRNEDTGPDGSIFNVDNWTYGFKALDDIATNTEATDPFQTESYPCMVINVLDENLKEVIKFYPNPTNGEITIDTDLDITKIQVANILGEIVFIENNASEKLNLNNLAQGTYIISFYTQDKFWSTKLIKR